MATSPLTHCPPQAPHRWHHHRRLRLVVRRDRSGPDRQDLDGGEIEEIPLPDRTAKPHAIVAASAGDCWLAEWGANRIGHITVTGEIFEYDLPSPSSEPHGITIGPDGALWAGS